MESVGDCLAGGQVGEERFVGHDCVRYEVCRLSESISDLVYNILPFATLYICAFSFYSRQQAGPLFPTPCLQRIHMELPGLGIMKKKTVCWVSELELSELPRRVSISGCLQPQVPGSFLLYRCLLTPSSAASGKDALHSHTACSYMHHAPGYVSF